MAIAEYSDEGYNQGGFYSRMRTVAIRNGKSNITSGKDFAFMPLKPEFFNTMGTIARF